LKGGKNMERANKFVLILIFCAMAIGMAGCETISAASKGIVAPPPVIPGAKFVGKEACAMCHEKIVKDFDETEHARIVVSDENIEGQACEACHGAGSLHVNAQTKQEKRATIVNPKKNPEACYKCHLEKKAEMSLEYHHPVPEGKMSCTDCHDPHSKEGVLPGSAKSIFDKNAVCAKCHEDQTKPFVYEHEALREGCTVCHNVHGSINPKMLKERDLNLCLKCHTQLTFPYIGGNYHVTNVQRGPCWSGSCHVAVHGSNYNKHLRI